MSDYLDSENKRDQLLEIIAYSYTDPLLESPPDPAIWGWEVDRLYQDLGGRSQWQQLILDLQQKTPHYLLIRKLAELGDTLTETIQNLTFLESFNLQIIAVEQDYTSAQFHNLPPQELKVKLSNLYQEITLKKRQTALKKGHANNRLLALPPPGKAPYGYRKGQDKYIIDRSSAPIVKAFFEQFLLFGSLRGAVKFIEKKYGKKIAVSTGKLWLQNPVYRGDLAYKKGEVIPNTHLPILSRDEAAQIDRLLRQNCQFSPKTASAPRSLAGLVICQTCQSKITITRIKVKHKQQEYLYLRPLNCSLNPTCKGIHYQAFLEQTINKICLELPQKVSQLKLPNLETIKGKISEAIATQEQLIETVKHLKQQGILDEETCQLRIYKINTEISKLQAKLSQLPPDNLTKITKVVAVSEFWLGLSEEERRFYFREFIKRVEIIRYDQKNFDLALVFVF